MHFLLEIDQGNLGHPSFILLYSKNGYLKLDAEIIYIDE